MADSQLRITTLGTTNLRKIDQYNHSLKGLAGVNTAAYAIFVKFYWFVPSGSAMGPTVGTTVPDVVLQIPTVAAITPYFSSGVTKPGDLWIAVTKLAADNDATAVVAGDGILTVFYE